MDTFTHDGLTFDATDSGPRDGDVVLLLHGFPQDRHAYDRVAARLNDAGLRTIAFDQRGYSPGATPGGRSAYGMKHLVRDALAAADAAGAQTFHVVGHDWGGAVAWALAEHAADRVRTVTVLSTPHPEALVRAFRTFTQAKKSWYMAFFQLPYVPERAIPRTLRRTYAGLPEADIERYVARFSTPESLTGPLNWYRAMAGAQVGALTRSLRSGRSGGEPAAPRHGITVPTTYIWGRRDFALGREAAELTQEYVEADYRFVELDAGHWLPELNADDVATTVLDRIRTAA
ncbi:alpha/beta fold hydrolase [Luteipulveratus flavus]|uniref:Alpha/beta fold hydrolase n=1 Tax=Luteipulveratus flavus TaxID=3031728 RepID=A0ABT6C8U0_9MICO|nr:alpha/beta fold hydrolase [Luteipulveratus sp. YIM 133296]MDF8264737.1 alpha/beta fold hydrolase [Luteipulveratus sp. YIM 133296]